MVSANELKGEIAKRGYSQRKVAIAIGMSEKTFYSKMKKGVFNSNEIEAMVTLLDITNPDDILRIFFANNVA